MDRKKQDFFRFLAFAGWVLASLAGQEAAAQAFNTETAGLQMPAGFSAKIIANKLGRTRHLEVTPQNDIYVRLARPVNGAGTLYLQQDGDTAKVKFGFGPFGGTGVFMRNGYLYTTSSTDVFRYKLDANNQVLDTAAPERIVTGLVAQRTHESKSITMDGAGNLYVAIGCPSNACQEEDRKKGSPGRKDCPLLETSGGVWMFKPDKKDQGYADGVRYATGLRNVVGLDWNDQANKLYVMQHGRDQLHSIFPDLYTVKDNAEQPAECMYAVNRGDHAGWPYTYYDQTQKKKMVAPEYGGNGKQSTTDYLDPVAAYPAHTAPNALLFYTGRQFPERYRNGAFIAFHGSWNRSPEPQAGYFVVFQPFKNGVPSGNWEVFADNFSGSPEKTASGRADHRPCGLAQGPDGALYVTDDVQGTIYKIAYNESSATAAPAEKASATIGKTGITKTVRTKKKEKAATAEKTKAGAVATAKAVDISNAAMAAGRAVYRQNCITCHQADGGGVGNLNPPLGKTSWVLGSKPRLINIILHGMKGKEVDGEEYNNAMPGFNYLSDRQVADVLTYVRNSFGNKASAVSPAEVKKVRSGK